MSMCKGLQALVMLVFGGVAGRSEGEEVARNHDETPGPHGI